MSQYELLEDAAILPQKAEPVNFSNHLNGLSHPTENNSEEDVSGDTEEKREDIGCQTTEVIPHVISDGKLLNGYYPKFSAIHLDFLKAKSLDLFLQQNQIPLANG